MTLPEFPWWPTCKGCDLHVIDPTDQPRYDVLLPGFDPDSQPSTDIGPYCTECWPNTITGQAE